MDNEIYIIDEYDKEHRVRYLDENRVIVQYVTRYVIGDGSTTEHINYSMPAKPLVTELDSWPYSAGLRKKILEFHAQFPDAK